MSWELVRRDGHESEACENKDDHLWAGQKAAKAKKLWPVNLKYPKMNWPIFYFYDFSIFFFFCLCLNCSFVNMYFDIYLEKKKLLKVKELFLYTLANVID